MSSDADNAVKKKFYIFFDVSLTTPTASIRSPHFLLGLPTKFSVVSYKILGPLRLTVFPVEKGDNFFAK
jgi:hypothetical protein